MSDVHKKAPSKPFSRLLFPETNAFVNAWNGERGQLVPVEAIDDKTFDVRRPSGVQIGSTWIFAYQIDCHKLRFKAECITITGGFARFELPESIQVVESFPNKRSQFRLRCALRATYRFLSGGGAGYAAFNSSLSDINASGASIMLAEQVKVGTKLQIEISLKPDTAPVVVVGSVVRAGLRQPAGLFMTGVRFDKIDSADRRRIEQFMADYQRSIKRRHLSLH